MSPQTVQNRAQTWVLNMPLGRYRGRWIGTSGDRVEIDRALAFSVQISFIGIGLRHLDSSTAIQGCTIASFWDDGQSE